MTGDGELMPKSKSLKEICLFLLDPAVMDIEEQAPATPSPQVATEDFLTPRNLRILRATVPSDRGMSARPQPCSSLKNPMSS